MKLLTPEEVLQAIKDRKPVEVKFGDDYEWELVKRCEMNIDELLNPEYLFRFPQKMITIGDVSFPKPLTDKPSINTKYYYPSSYFHLFDNGFWNNTELDCHRLKLGMLHLTKENAIAHAKALIKLSGGTYE